jgi:hypothetical protein
MHITNHERLCNTKSCVANIHSVHRQAPDWFVIRGSDTYLHRYRDAGPRSYLEGWLRIVSIAARGDVGIILAGHTVKLCAGQQIASRAELARQLGWPEGAVRTFLHHASQWGMITIERPQDAVGLPTAKQAPAILTVTDYEEHQSTLPYESAMRGDIAVRADIFDHGLVGIRHRAYTEGEAVLRLICLQQQHEARPTMKLPYIYGIFDWQPRKARDFVVHLTSRGVLNEDFASVLLTRFPRRIPVKRFALPNSTRQAVWAKTSGRCVYCAQPLTMKTGLPNSFHADHVLSVARGGSDDIANLIPSCATCNARKSAKPFLAFIEAMEADDA